MAAPGPDVGDPVGVPVDRGRALQPGHVHRVGGGPLASTPAGRSRARARTTMMARRIGVTSPGTAPRPRGDRCPGRRPNPAKPTKAVRPFKSTDNRAGTGPGGPHGYTRVADDSFAPSRGAAAGGAAGRGRRGPSSPWSPAACSRWRRGGGAATAARPGRGRRAGADGDPGRGPGAGHRDPRGPGDPGRARRPGHGWWPTPGGCGPSGSPGPGAGGWPATLDDDGRSWVSTGPLAPATRYRVVAEAVDDAGTPTRRARPASPPCGPGPSCGRRSCPWTARRSGSACPSASGSASRWPTGPRSSGASR